MRNGELAPESRALLFRQLAQTERAGLTLSDTIRILLETASKSLKQRLLKFQAELSGGSTLTKAGLNSELFFAWEARLISAAEESGMLYQSYAGLAQRYSSRASRQSKIKGGLLLPLAIFVLVVFIAPIPKLFGGDIQISYYIFITFGRLTLLLSSIYLLYWSWRRLAKSGADNSIFRGILHMPYFGGLILQQQRYDYLNSLALLLDAGVPAFDALDVAANSISHPTLRTRFAQAASIARGGASVTDSLNTCGALADANTMNLVNTGEFAGRLSEILHNISKAQHEQLELRYVILSEWIPRVTYLTMFILFAFIR